MRFFDAHNHLQDDRFGGRQPELLQTAAQQGVIAMVVNGAAESDWPQVLELARHHPAVIPSFGYHPWYVHEQTPEWRQNLKSMLENMPCAIGEIGLDRWKEGLDFAQQQEAFDWQMRLAAERDLPVSIHCLQAWGPLVDRLRSGPRPGCGFVLHSYGGSVELIQPLAGLGAYFSLPGYFAHERKARQRDTFRHVPPDRLLIETDAPDQLLPDERNRHRLTDADGRRLNHPANLGAVYEFAAELLDRPLDQLAPQVEENFTRLFGKVMRPAR
jgi:TatD DNase family protein